MTKLQKLTENEFSNFKYNFKSFEDIHKTSIGDTVLLVCKDLEKHSKSGEEEEITSSDCLVVAESGLHFDASENTLMNPGPLAGNEEVVRNDAEPTLLNIEDRVLFHQGDASETSVELLSLEDPLANIDGRNMALSNNAIEDMPQERVEPILYTHSDGEDKAFIDYELKPLQIDTSRCSRTPLFLGRVFKGRKTFSPSHMVTRSKARLLTEGRKNTPLGLLDESDDSANSFDNDIIQAFKLSCPVKKEAAPKPPINP
ncbi:unnamed protein product [Cuscuta campestris]|uniref:Uncharacterized protein n=1 Tax=Cuscuta campestris TaxID=132261 RepID=A0A484LVT9_9ASTE|nr:unnamed protein product [Cuscuta campestris]